MFYRTLGARFSHQPDFLFWQVKQRLKCFNWRAQNLLIFDSGLHVMKFIPSNDYHGVDYFQSYYRPPNF